MTRGLTSLCLGLLLCAEGGCMVHEQRIERAPGPPRPLRGAPIAGSERVYVLLVPRMDQLELRVRAEAQCAVRSVQRVERMRVDTSRAAGGRFIGAAAAFVGSAVLLSGPGSDTLGSVLLGTGAGIVVIPILAEDEERRPLPPEEQVATGASTVSCGDRPVRAARVAVRLGLRTLEGQSDVAGRVRFRDERAAPDMSVFVDDVAVPLSVGTPPTGTLPASEGPARPDAPDSR